MAGQRSGWERAPNRRQRPAKPRNEHSQTLFVSSLLACSAGTHFVTHPDLVDQSKVCKVLTHPDFLSPVDVPYPPSLKDSHTEGNVTAELIVGVDGGVRARHVLHATDQQFGDAVLAAAADWRFTPGACDGVPVEMRLQIRIAFRMR